MGALIHGASDLGPVSLTLPPPFLCAACSRLEAAAVCPCRRPCGVGICGKCGHARAVRVRGRLVKETNHAFNSSREIG